MVNNRQRKARDSALPTGKCKSDVIDPEARHAADVYRLHYKLLLQPVGAIFGHEGCLDAVDCNLVRHTKLAYKSMHRVNVTLRRNMRMLSLPHVMSRPSSYGLNLIALML